MRRVAVFGNTGGGKSTLAKRLAEVTGLPLHVIDIIQYPDGKYRPGETDGGKFSSEAYRTIHADILCQDQWIIYGFESVPLAWERFAVADALVYVDLPILAHYWGVTTRFATGLFKNPIWLAGAQSYLGKHAGRLQGRRALPSLVDAEVSSVRSRSGLFQARSSLAIARGDGSIHSGRHRRTTRLR